VIGSQIPVTTNTTTTSMTMLLRTVRGTGRKRNVRPCQNGARISSVGIGDFSQKLLSV